MSGSGRPVISEAGREAEAEAILETFRRRFWDLSIFVKELKERFSRWFNKHHGRRGTLWMDRFKCVLVEDGEALRTMALYIDAKETTCPCEKQSLRKASPAGPEVRLT